MTGESSKMRGDSVIPTWTTRNGPVVALSLLFLFCAQAHALTTQGYLKGFAVQSPPQESPQRTTVLAGRALLRGSLFEETTCEVAYELRSIKTDGISQVELTPLEYRFADLNRQVVGEDQGYQVLQNLDRLYCRFEFNSIEATLGRSPVTFGSARYFPTMDVLLPYSYAEIDREYRIGVDVARLRWSIGAFSEIDVGWVIGREVSQNGALFARATSHHFGTDIEVLAMSFQKAMAYGLGIQSSLWKLGIWSEVTQVVPSASESYLRGTLGLSYIWPNQITSSLEIHHSTVSTSNEFAFSKGGVFFTGMDYAALGIGWNFSPLWNLGASIIHRFGIEISTLIAQTLEYNANENLYFDLGSFWNLENDGEFKEASPVIYLDARIYF